ncbi:hypothetical protein Tco_0699982 [Tanacetum coccineum]
MAVLESCPKHNMVAYLEKTDGNAEYITAKVAGKPVSISEASIRSDLLFYDANGIDSLPNQAIFDAIQLMGHLDAKKIFVMYPRFISMFLDKQLMNVPVPLDHFPVNALTSKVFSFMVKKGKHFSGKVTPLFASMLVQPTEDEGATSERPSEPQPTPSPPHPKSSGGNHGGQSSSDKSLSGNEGDMTLQSVYDLCISLCTQVTDQAKEIKHLKAQLKKLQKKAKPNAQDVGRTRDVVNEEKETADDKVSTKDALSTAKKSTDDRTEERSATPTTPTTNPTMFGEEKLLLRFSPNMTKPKAVFKRKEKGVELRDVLKRLGDQTYLSTQWGSHYRHKRPLPKIDPKDKGKRPLKAKDESGTEEDVKKLAEEEAIKTALSNEYDFIQARIEADRLLALRLQHEEREKFTIEERAKFLHDTIAAQRRMKRSDEDFISIGSAEDERLIKKMNEKGIDSSKNESVKEEDKEEEGTKKRKGGHIKMIARKKKRSQSDVDSDDEHKKCLKIVTFESILDSEIMEKKSVIARLNKVSSPDGDYLVIYRANGNFRAFNYLMEVLHIFDRQDLFHLYDLMREQYSEVTLDGFALILWGDLKIMMESSTEGNEQSDFWSGQQDWKIVTWRLYESCGVCILEFEDGIVIHMLVERRYPLSKDLLQRMLDLGLEVERESSVALDLIRFIKQQIDEE